MGWQGLSATDSWWWIEIFFSCSSLFGERWSNFFTHIFQLCWIKPRKPGFQLCCNQLSWRQLWKKPSGKRNIAGWKKNCQFSIGNTLELPPPVTVTTRIIPFLVGNPELNLHLWLESWVGGRPSRWRREPGSSNERTTVTKRGRFPMSGTSYGLFGGFFFGHVNS